MPFLKMPGCLEVSSRASRKHPQSHTNTVFWLCYCLVGRRTFSPEVVCSGNWKVSFLALFTERGASIRMLFLSHEAQTGGAALTVVLAAWVVPTFFWSMEDDAGHLSTCNAIF